ncbi:uncharacterized protein LOC112056709 [Bicyclus anynana]|uniref:Uncharacterized protein LOC112056709 n=1 Tax=Bicyclus anynana TaxID=110368 RepID=A0ABM3LYI8_BICAN|nr:uncharacterized protein LOC112056709 [Bicyclus anynana]
MTDYIKISTLLLVILYTVTSRASIILFQDVNSVNVCTKSTDTCTFLLQCDFAMDLLNSIKYNPSSRYKIFQKLVEMRCKMDGSSYLMVCCPNKPPADSIVYVQTEETATTRPNPLTTTTPAQMAPEPVKMAVFPSNTVSKLTLATAPVEEDIFPDRNICGQLTSNDRIFGGSITAIDEYPWIARIKYSDRRRNGSKKTRYACSATLITDRHLITAAHCVSTKQIAYAVSLGDWNLDSPTECYEGQCPDPPVEYEIESIVIHPGYIKENYTFGDIAIIKLKQRVTFTDFIQPICLPTTEYIKMQDYTHNSVYWTAGWGVTEFGELSMVKRKVDIEAVPIDICRAALPQIPESSSRVLICAGGQQGKDTCAGDSGGPLMREVRENYRMNWFLYGVISFGAKSCGSVGIPGVSTRVTAYMDWIRNIVQTSRNPASNFLYVRSTVVNLVCVITIKLISYEQFTMTDYIKISTLLLIILYTVTAHASNIVFHDTDKQMECDISSHTCKHYSDCEFALELLKSVNESNRNQTIEKMKEAKCGYNGSDMVCCPNTRPAGSIVYDQTEETATNRPNPLTTKTPVPIATESLKMTVVPSSTISELTVTAAPVEPDIFPDRNICGQSTSNDKILGGSITAIDEYPWMARIKYADRRLGGVEIKYLCSATLITDRHLITAAHCLLEKDVEPIAVSLGDWNLDSPTECYEGQCPEPSVEIRIEYFVHQGFSKENHTFGDIAIIKLEQPVNFTGFIQPICLPTTEYIKMQDYTHSSVYWTAGWGITEFGEQSLVKRKVDIEAVPIDVCRAAIPEIPESSSPGLICAGGQQGKDSCRGDSGGPLMREVRENYRANWFLYGVTSFGSKRCGLAGIPGVYTRVTAYMDWIRNVVQT